MTHEPTGRADPSRRALVRAGLHTAWAAPAIALVTAAPAVAASGQPSVTASNVMCDAGGAAQRRTITATFANANSQPTTGLMVVMDFNPQVGTVDAQWGADVDDGWFQVMPDYPQGPPADNRGYPTLSRNLRQAVFYRVGPQLTGSGGALPSITITFTMNVVPAGPASTVLTGSIVVTPYPTPGSGTAGAGVLV